MNTERERNFLAHQTRIREIERASISITPPRIHTTKPVVCDSAGYEVRKPRGYCIACGKKVPDESHYASWCNDSCRHDDIRKNNPSLWELRLENQRKKRRVIHSPVWTTCECGCGREFDKRVKHRKYFDRYCKNKSRHIRESLKPKRIHHKLKVHNEA